MAAGDMEAWMAQMREVTQTALESARASQAQVQAMLAERTSGNAGISSRDLLKVLKPPEPYRPENRDQELAQWRTWSWELEQYLSAVDAGFSVDFAQVRATRTPILMDSLTVEQRNRSALLYSLLVSLLHEKGKQLLKTIRQNSGFESYRQLLEDLVPYSRTRTLALLQTINQWPTFDHKVGICPQLTKLESAIEEYEQLAGMAMDGNMKLAVLLRCVHGQLRQHLNLVVTDSTSYQEVRNLVLRWDAAQTKWGASLASSYELGKSADGPSPMDIDRIKGDHKGGKGKGKSKDKGKGKGKDQYFKGFSKGKGKSKNDGFQKGKGKQSKGYEGDKDTCRRCGKKGHWEKDCWQPPQSGRVNQAQEESGAQFHAAGSPVNGSAGSTTSSVPTSATTFRTAPAIRRVDAFSYAECSDFPCVDLTAFDLTESDDILDISMIACGPQKRVDCASPLVDMSYSDKDGVWHEDQSPWIESEAAGVFMVSSNQEHWSGDPHEVGSGR